jgi:hypothetical protein
MDKQTLDQLEAELREIIRLEEQFIKYSLLTPGDVISLQELAENASPRAELLYGLYLIVVERSDAEGYQWLERCQRHCNGLFLWKIRMVYKALHLKQDSCHIVN